MRALAVLSNRAIADILGCRCWLLYFGESHLAALQIMEVIALSILYVLKLLRLNYSLVYTKDNITRSYFQQIPLVCRWSQLCPWQWVHRRKKPTQEGEPTRRVLVVPSRPQVPAMVP